MLPNAAEKTSIIICYVYINMEAFSLPSGKFHAKVTQLFVILTVQRLSMIQSSQWTYLSELEENVFKTDVLDVHQDSHGLRGGGEEPCQERTAHRGKLTTCKQEDVYRMQ